MERLILTRPHLHALGSTNVLDEIALTMELKKFLLNFEGFLARNEEENLEKCRVALAERNKSPKRSKRSAVPLPLPCCRL